MYENRSFNQRLISKVRCCCFLSQADKVQYINHVKEIPTKEGRNAAMALFCQQVQEAEMILLQAGLIFRAIHMHIDLFNWDR